MMTISEFKRNAKVLNLCGKYSALWDNAKDDKELMELALDSNGVVFMAGMCNTEYGIETQYLRKMFPLYANGTRKANFKGYNSCMYAGLEGEEITVSTTLLLLIGCNCRITVPDNHACRIYLDRACKDIQVEIGRNGLAEVYIFGESTSISFSGDKKGGKTYWMYKENKELTWIPRKRQ